MSELPQTPSHNIRLPRRTQSPDPYDFYSAIPDWTSPCLAAAKSVDVNNTRAVPMLYELTVSGAEPMWDEKVWVTIGDAHLEIPAALKVDSGTPIDSASAVFKGGGMTVIIDQGPFADRLDSYVGESKYEQQAAPLAGTVGRIIRFDRPDGTFTVACRITEPIHLTVVVHCEGFVPEQAARGVIESIRITS